MCCDVKSRVIRSLTVVFESVDNVVSDPGTHTAVVEGIWHFVGVEWREEIPKRNVNIVPMEIV